MNQVTNGKPPTHKLVPDLAVLICRRSLRMEPLALGPEVIPMPPVTRPTLNQIVARPNELQFTYQH